jgi:sugar/nucleoside kinase (ribokinase family)
VIGAISRITLDLVYADFPRIPGVGEEVATSRFTLALGGGPAAALINAGRLGAPVKLAASLGNDFFSGIAKSFLDREPLEYASFYPSGSQGIPVNITSVMSFGGQDRSFVSYFSPEPFYSAFSDAIYEYLKGVSICIASEPFPDLFRALNRDGCKIIYDVGWQDDLSLESLKDVLDQVYLFAPNEKEALKITGAPNAEEALAVLARCLPQPVIKLGGRGALVWKDGGAILLPPFDFEAADSTGAGDAFLGGMSYGLFRGWDIFRCAELGNYAGGKAVTALGCLAARPGLDEFELLRKARERE